MIKNRKNINKTYFDHPGINKNLKSKAIQGGSISILAKILNTIIQIAGVAILARLLSPNDFGLVAMATVITGFFFVFHELGLEDATIQASRITHEQISTLFWINLGFGFLVTIILMASSPVVAWFFKEPQLIPVVMVSSINFVFYGLYTQHLALLKKNMLFVEVSIIEILSGLLSTVASIIMALLGMKYWAIIFRHIFFPFFKAIFAWIFCHWRPGVPRRNTNVRPLLKIGANSVGFYMVNYFAANLDKTLIGKKFGAEQLGYYSRAYYLSIIPAGYFTQAIFHVAVSTLSKLRDEPEKYHRYYLNALSIVSFLGMPISIFMAITSKDLIYLLLGPQWNQAAGIFSILGLSAGMNILYGTSGWIHVSLGRTDRWFKWGIIGSLILISGFIIGLFFGPRGVALAYTIVIIILTLPGILYAGSPIGLKFRDVFSSIWRHICASIFAGAVTNFIKNLVFYDSNILLRMIFVLLIYFIIYLTFLIVLYGDIKPIIKYFQLYKNILAKVSSKKRTTT